MRPVSDLYKRLLTNPEHRRETKVSIAGVEYQGPDKIYACSTAGGLFQDATVGSCISRSLTLTIRPAGTIPRMAQISLFYRLTLGSEASEWIPRGIFYIDTRTVDEVSGLLTIKGYDAMRKAEAVWWDPSEDAGEWPMLQTDALADIAAIMGVEVDPRTDINPVYKVEYPNDSTMREVLGHIAASHAGNWIMTGDGKLLLAPLFGMPIESSLLVDSMDGKAILMGDVRLIV